MNLVEKIFTLSDNLIFPVEELPARINRMKALLDDITFQTKHLIIKQDRAISSYNITMAEYRRNRPLIETLKANEVELLL